MDKTRLEFENDLNRGAPFVSEIRKDLSYDIPHYHNELEIVYVKQGTLKAICDTECFDAKPGEFFIFMPGVVHSFEKLQNNAIYYAKIPPTTASEADFSSLRLKSCVIRNNDPLHQILEPPILKLFEEREKMLFGYEFAILRYSNEIFEKLLRSGALVPIPKYEQTKIAARLTLLKTVDAYIAKNYREKIELDDAARACGYSKYYFAHYFKMTTQMSFYSYVTAFRLEKALSALHNSNKSITEIAHDFGFGSVRSFDRMFRKYYSTSPGEHLKMHNKNHRRGI